MTWLLFSLAVAAMIYFLLRPYLLRYAQTRREARFADYLKEEREIMARIEILKEACKHHTTNSIVSDPHQDVRETYLGFARQAGIILAQNGEQDLARRFLDEAHLATDFLYPKGQLAKRAVAGDYTEAQQVEARIAASRILK